MKVKYKLKQIYPSVYLCKIEDMYDLTMTFCRAQEFYESPFKQIRGKKICLLELMAIYSKRNGGSFTYTVDWAGFNLKGSTIEELYKLGIDDFNVYDSIVLDIHTKILEEVGSSNYYLIGSNSDKCTIAHELCHALYYLDKDYKKTVKNILKQLHKSVHNKIANVLYDLGYCKAVIDDEIQAYLSTEFCSLKEKTKFNKRELVNITNATLKFRNNFKKYKEKIKI
jgi:hypothetical protein